MDGDYKTKLFSIFLPKTNAYIKSYNTKLNGCVF